MQTNQGEEVEQEVDLYIGVEEEVWWHTEYMEDVIQEDQAPPTMNQETWGEEHGTLKTGRQ